MGAVFIIRDEAAMNELMPVLLGAGIGMRYVRDTLWRRMPIALIVAAAMLASVSSGELTSSWGWIVADLALVTAGVVAVWTLHALRLAHRRRRQRAPLLTH